MPFHSGSIAYARFAVRGGPTAVTNEVLDELAANVLTPPAIGAPPETQAGWVAGRHVFDTSFDPEAVVFGETLLFGMRIDTNRVPAELRRAYFAMAQQAMAAASPTGIVSGREKKAARDEADERCREELSTDRFRRSKLIPIVWQVDQGLLFAPLFGDAPVEMARALLRDTFDAQLVPLSSGRLAESILDASGRSRDYEDLAPTAFTPPPASAESMEQREANVPPVPWAAAVDDAKDFLGNEFLFWLWSRCETGAATFETSRGSVAIALDRMLDMQCAWDVTGTQSLRADAPTRLPEARAALRLGKWPRKVGITIATRGEQWDCGLQADRFVISGAKLARPEEPPATPREGIEQRLAALETIDRGLVGLYELFVEERTASAWNSTREGVRRWIAGTRPPATAASVPVIEIPPSVSVPVPAPGSASSPATISAAERAGAEAGAGAPA